MRAFRVLTDQTKIEQKRKSDILHVEHFEGNRMKNFRENNWKQIKVNKC